MTRLPLMATNAAVSIDLGQWWQGDRRKHTVQIALMPVRTVQMFASFDNPFSVFAIALIAQVIAALTGDFIRKHARSFKQGERHDFSIIQAAILTLLALIIGFSFSMAVSRYDQRKTLEEAEANAIGTAYLRAELLPEKSASRAQELLREYLDLRIAFYEESRARPAAEIEQ